MVARTRSETTESLWIVFTGAGGMLPETRQAANGEDAVKVAVLLLSGLPELRDGDVLSVVRPGKVTAPLRPRDASGRFAGGA